MNISNFFFRQKQKLKYHIAKSDIERAIIEINKFSEEIELSDNYFRIKGFDMSFPNTHIFVINRFHEFKFLLTQSGGSFKVVNEQLVFNYLDLNLIIKTAEELFIISEVFFQQIYNILINTSFNVIDIGMNVGYTSLYFANREDVKQVYSFEPFSITFQDAEDNFAINPRIESKIIRYNIGLGLKDQTLNLNFSSEFKGKNRTNVAENSKIKMNLTDTIKLVNARNEIDKIISERKEDAFIVKMDCEGAEFDIFESYNGFKIPNNIVAFIIEWHTINPSPIVKKLVTENFSVHCTNTGKIGFIIAMR